jgi:hypothetical protein
MLWGRWLLANESLEIVEASEEERNPSPENDQNHTDDDLLVQLDGQCLLIYRWVLAAM